MLLFSFKLILLIRYFSPKNIYQKVATQSCRATNFTVTSAVNFRQLSLPRFAARAVKKYDRCVKRSRRFSNKMRKCFLRVRQRRSTSLGETSWNNNGDNVTWLQNGLMYSNNTVKFFSLEKRKEITKLLFCLLCVTTQMWYYDNSNVIEKLALYIWTLTHEL